MRDGFYHYYICTNCKKLKRNTEEHSKRGLPSINVAIDYSAFLSNPAVYPQRSP
jgi:rRNA-processing protein FCF1